MTDDERIKELQVLLKMFDLDGYELSRRTGYFTAHSSIPFVTVNGADNLFIIGHGNHYNVYVSLKHLEVNVYRLTRGEPLIWPHNMAHHMSTMTYPEED